MTPQADSLGAACDLAGRSEGSLGSPLAVLVLTCDEERNIGACLDSVIGWADQVLVVDSGSRDRTIELCAARGVTVVHHDYLDHRSQMDWAITSPLWKHDWLLLLDADNRVSSELKTQIDDVLRRDDNTVHGYYNPHHHYFRNRRVYGLKAYWLRLIRRGHVVVDQSELVDFRLVVNGPTGKLSGVIVESNQKELDIDFWIDKHQNFARRMAIEEILRKAGLTGWSKDLRPSLLGDPDQRMIWLKNRWYGMPTHWRAFAFFLYRYFFCLGFLGGSNGLIYYFLQALWFRLLVDLKMSEYRSLLRRGEITIDDLVISVGLPVSAVSGAHARQSATQNGS
jgi:glycosyltransferase involved in cell wall biosynthesis